MKRFFVILMTLFLSLNAFAELKYIEISSKQNLPMVRIKTIEDFEAIIRNYDISLVFLQYDIETRPSSALSFQPLTKSNEAFVIAENTYFIFSLEGYKTLADYKAGKNSNYKSAYDYEQAKSLGIDDAEFFYYYTRNSFHNVADANEAYKNGFVLYKAFKSETNFISGQKYLAVIENNPKNQESDAYYEAKKMGYANYKDYKEYLNYSAKGFKTKDEYQAAKSKGFSNAGEEKTATEAGFTNNEEYSDAKSLGLNTKSDFTTYKEITRAIDNIIEERKLPKKHATLYYFIQKLPKSECAISILSKTLTDNYNENSPELKNALNSYLKTGPVQQANKTTKAKIKPRASSPYPQITNNSDLFSETRLKEFFASIDISQLGTYSSDSEIFKKK
ncbi:MAG TPA: hypothetical protein DCF70_05470 [Treponema sp.]|nr:hypothetical protein [Treponema sp.]